MSGVEKYRDELIATARAMAAPGKGLLAADESTGTIGQRFADIGVENTEENRRLYRQLLFTTPGNWEKYISGIILYEETLYQKDDNKLPFVDLLKKRGVIPGIKVDKGAKPLQSGLKGDFYTQGITDLDARCKKYYQQGARFAKWRAVYTITEEGAPSELCIQENARNLAKYASICQHNGLVPIVEPEILMNGKHSLQKSFNVTQRVHAAVFKALHDYDILFEGMILKPNMVVQGEDSTTHVNAKDVARLTVKLLKRTVPPAVPGVMFLSGGLSEEDATVFLAEMNSLGEALPWSLSFSYGRALQKSTLEIWKGKSENVKKAQEVYYQRAKACYEAALPRKAKSNL